MASKLPLLKKSYPSKKIEAMETFFIDGELLVTKKFVAKDMGVTERTVEKWEAQGFEASIYSMSRLKLYDIVEFRKWHKINVNQKFNPHSDDTKDNDKDLEAKMLYKVGDEVTAFNAVSAKQVEEANIKIRDREIVSIKAKEATGEYIRADDVDKITTEMTVILLSAWRSLLDTLPSLLVMKSQKEVHDILDTEFEAEVHVLERKINES